MDTLDHVITLKVDTNTRDQLYELEDHYRKLIVLEYPRSPRAAIIRMAINDLYKKVIENGKNREN